VSLQGGKGTSCGLRIARIVVSWLFHPFQFCVCWQFIYTTAESYGAPARPNQTMDWVFGDNIYTIQADNVIMTQSATFYAKEGSLYNFPFDSYVFNFNVICSQSVPPFKKHGFLFKMSQDPIAGFLPSAKIAPPADTQSYATITVTFTRVKIAVVYPIFVALGMWGMCVCVCV
jgi:hypothetical protein